MIPFGGVDWRPLRFPLVTTLRYLAFYLLGGLVATLAQVAVDPRSTVPNLGASGAIAAVMGAFLITYPRDTSLGLLISQQMVGI